MKKQILIVGIIVLLIVVGLSGCTNNNSNPSISDEEKLIGVWTNHTVTFAGPTEQTLVFFFDGTFYNNLSDNGTYEIKDGKLVLTYPIGTMTYDYSFSNNDKTLTLIEIGTSTTEIYEKQ